MKFKAASAILFLAVSAVADFPDGNQAFDHGHYEKAILEYEKILAKGHVSSALHHNLANAYLEMGDPVAAREILTGLSLSQDPGIKERAQALLEKAGA